MKVESDLIVVALVLLSVLPIGCSSGESTILPGPSNADASLTKPDGPTLIAQERQGENPIRVIVTLEFEGGAKASPREIAKLQDNLLRTLYQQNVQVVRRFSSLPMVTLVVDRATYKMLALLPIVKSIELDALNRPMESVTGRAPRE